MKQFNFMRCRRIWWCWACTFDFGARLGL